MKQPFSVDEERRMRIGNVEVAIRLTEKRPDGFARPRHYRATINHAQKADSLPVNVQLNHGDGAGDEDRLRRLLTVLTTIAADGDEEKIIAREAPG